MEGASRRDRACPTSLPSEMSALWGVGSSAAEHWVCRWTRRPLALWGPRGEGLSQGLWGGAGPQFCPSLRPSSRPSLHF